MNIFFEWIFGILKKIIVFMNEYSGFLENEYFFEWVFWIYLKWIMFGTNIQVLVCPRQQWLSLNVSNSSDINQG